MDHPGDVRSPVARSGACANVGLVVSKFGDIAAALDLVGVSRYVSVPIAAVVIWALVVFGSYRYAERLFLILSLAFLPYPIAAVLAHPHLGAPRPRRSCRTRSAPRRSSC